MVETDIAPGLFESPMAEPLLMERICEWRNMDRALRRVVRNKGRPGPDGMTVKQLSGYLKRHWPKIREQLLTGTYRPQPVKRVEIPKPDGGVRKLGVPTAVDRFIQQAALQVQICSRMGTNSCMLLIFFSCRSRYGSSRWASIFSGSVTK